jgi:hypothetical protein
MEYNDLKEMALKKYAGDETKAEAFCEGFAKEAAAELGKEAGLWDHQMNGGTIGGGIVSGASDALGKGIGSVTISAALSGIHSVIGGVANMANYRKFLAALEQAIKINRVLKNADKQRVLAYGETIFKFAPHVAMDPNVLASTLAGAIDGDGLDPNTIRMLTELEAKYKDSMSFSPKNYK